MHVALLLDGFADEDIGVPARRIGWPTRPQDDRHMSAAKDGTPGVTGFDCAVVSTGGADAALPSPAFATILCLIKATGVRCAMKSVAAGTIVLWRHRR